MNTSLYALLTVAFAGTIHAGFSLSASLLELLSGHSLSRRRSHGRLLLLSGSFIVGSAAMIFLLLTTFTYAALVTQIASQPLTMLLIGTLAMLDGVWVLFFYYRRASKGAALWLPRSFARYLNERTRHTKNPFEAAVLGAAGVIYELPITIALLLTAAVIVASLPSLAQSPVLAGYAVVSILPLVMIFGLIGGGHNPSKLTHFRAGAKRFVQFVLGLSLFLLGGALFVNVLYGLGSM